MIPKSLTLMKGSSKIIQREKSINLSSIEDSIIVHKNMSIRFLSNPKSEIKGFFFENFLLSKNLSETNSKEKEGSIQKRTYPLLLSPICFYNIFEESLEIPKYLSWNYIQKNINW